MGTSKYDVSVDNVAPQRRPFQFSLRKLMLWTVAWAACLSALRLVPAYLSVLGVPNPLSVAVCLIIYLAIMFPIRIIWGAERGARIAVLGTCLVLAFAIETDVTHHWTEVDLAGSGGNLPVVT
jgi:hypothetical protein